MDHAYRNARLAAHIDSAAFKLCLVEQDLLDRRQSAQAAKASELLLDLLYLRRELLELPAQTGVPAPLEDEPDSVDEVPF